jgi:pimeloyl-ACP methyl ester carboxylesterase
MNRIRLSDIELSVRQEGSGVPLLLVHGFPLDHTMWEGQICDLASDFQLIAPDLRGFGASDVTDGTVTMQRLAMDLGELLDALEVAEPVVLCGLSMGGYVAWEFWRQYRSRIKKLILCDTKAVPDTPEAAQTRLESAARAIQEGTGFLSDTMIEKLFAPETGKNQPHLIRDTRQKILNTSPIGVAATLRGMAQRSDATDLLPEINVPTLVICGQHDAISTVDEMRRMADRISGSRFVMIPNAGHMAPLECPGPVNQAIRDFLKRSG